MSSAGPEGNTADQFCVTEGRITRLESKWMRVDSSKMRAVLGWTSKPEAELRFRFAGETAERALLLSGAERTQIGLKLKAQDDCNVVYVMWRISPISTLMVSVKSNPGQHRHGECGNSGYTNVKGTLKRPLPQIEERSEHSLRATLDATTLVVHVDGAVAWEGNIGDDALRFNGPVGLRSDNALFDFQFIAPTASGTFNCDKNRTE